MGWTKRQFVEQAFEEIGLASYVYDLTSDQLQGALRTLDTMMATWNAKDIKIGYPLPSSPENSDLDEETGVPDAANEAIYLGLSIRIAPRFGKVISPESKQFARDAYRTLLSSNMKTPEMKLPTSLPAGAGHKSWRDNDNSFIRETDDGIIGAPDNEIGFN